MNLLDLADRVRRADGVDAFNERTRMAFAGTSSAAARVELTVTDGTIPIAAAFAVDDAPVELAVDPHHRQRGHAAALLDRMLDAGERRFWAHGDLPAAQAFAESRGLTPARVLLHMGRSGPIPESPAQADVAIRTYTADDVPALLEVNALAFADHPEQGAMDQAAFDRLTREDWFDAAGLFVAEQAGKVIGFHWTKIAEGQGEIYVLGVSPASQSRGVGAALAVRGLRYLWRHGIDRVHLYVEADNVEAVALYRSLGFGELGRDVMYVLDR